MKLEATHLRERRYAVRPEGCLGTCGWKDGAAWQVIYVTASSPEQAIARAHRMHWWTRDDAAEATPPPCPEGDCVCGHRARDHHGEGLPCQAERCGCREYLERSLP